MDILHPEPFDDNTETYYGRLLHRYALQKKVSPVSDHKHCSSCGQTKLRTEFHNSTKSPDGLLYQCKACRLKRVSQYNKSHYDAGKTRNKHLKKTYGITREEYQAMLEAQGGVCAVCGQCEMRRDRNGNIEPLHVDHDHRTGKVRDLLCNGCNAALGLVDDNADRLSKLITYIGKWKNM